MPTHSCAIASTCSASIAPNSQGPFAASGDAAMAAKKGFTLNGPCYSPGTHSPIFFR